MRKFFTLFVAALCCASMFAEEQALPGKFTVNAEGAQVRFSDGYLAKSLTTGDLGIFDPQYEIGYGSIRWLYFCWGTGNNPTEKRVQVDKFVDWGVNPIGDDTEGNLWRTLSADEWQYIISGRENAEYLCGFAKINIQTEEREYQGLMLFPDNLYVEPGNDYDGDGLNLPDGITFESYKRNGNSFSYSHCSEYTEAQWEALEQAGAVFMPETYLWDGDDYMNYGGYNAVWCWTSTPAESSNSAKCLHITADGKADQVIVGMTKYFSLPVRLVKNVDPTEAIENIATPSDKARKVMMDGQLYIANPDGAIFDAQGTKVK